MNKADRISEPDDGDVGDLAPEYDFSGGVRGKYAERYAAGSNVVVLSPDVAQVFRDSQAVNDALRALIRIARQQVKSSPS